MKKLFIAVVCLATAAAAWAAVHRSVTAEEAHRIIAEKKPVVLDVRTPEEFREGHLPGAVNIDVSSPDFEARLKRLDPEKPHLVYCRSGNRSKRALNTLKKRGFREIYEMNRGIKDWIGAGYPLER